MQPVAVELDRDDPEAYIARDRRRALADARVDARPGHAGPRCSPTSPASRR